MGIFLIILVVLGVILGLFGVVLLFKYLFEK